MVNDSTEPTVSWGAPEGASTRTDTPSLMGAWGAGSDEYGNALVDGCYANTPFVKFHGHYESVMRKVCNVFDNGDDHYQFRYVSDREEFNNIGSGWSLERINPGLIDVTDPTRIDKGVIDMYSIYIQPTITQKMEDYSFVDMEDFISKKATRCFNVELDKVCLHGSGIDRPKGIMNHTFSDSQTEVYGTINEILSGTAGQITLSSLLAAYYALSPTFLPGAVWMMHPRTMRQIRALDGVGFHPDGSGTEILFGHPVVFNEFLAIPANNARVVIFGNFKEACYFIDAKEKFDVDRYTFKPLIAYYIHRNFGFGVVNTRALKVIKLAV